MYILVTDVLSCPRCGPEFGLILLSERAEARRVLEGVVACANCRERYGIRAGFADLRASRVSNGAGVVPPGEAEPAAARPAGGEPDGSRVFRMLALLGITEGPALALVIGESAAFAAALADGVEHLEVIVADGTAASVGERAGVTRVALAGRLPFHDRSLRGVALVGGVAAGHLEEAARVLAPLGRLVVEGGGDVRARVERAGLRVLAEEAGTLVAMRG